MITRIINFIQYLINKSIKPEMIGGYRNSDGTHHSKTSVSNMTHISQKKDLLSIGDNVFIGHFNYIDAYNAKVEIGDNCQITNYVSILTHSSHNELRYPKYVQLNQKDNSNIFLINPIKIGSNTYIGPHSVIMPGSILGKGCIVSAFSYVNGVFPDYSIIRGQPARIIGSTKDIDKDLIESNPDLKDFYFELIKVQS